MLRFSTWLFLIAFMFACGGEDEEGRKENRKDPKTSEQDNVDSEDSSQTDPTSLVERINLAKFKDFSFYCNEARTNSRESYAHTIEMLLKEAKTSDCNAANKVLQRKTALFLNDSKISDVRPLSHFTQLKKLSLINNKVTDVYPLSTLKNLEYLALSGNEISDISKLMPLTNLKVFLTARNSIKSASAANKISKLEYFSFAENGIKTKTTEANALQALKKEKLQWKYGENVCFGGWKVDKYAKCRDKAHGVELYKVARSKACGEESRIKMPKSCRDESHGVERFSDRIVEKVFEEFGAEITVRVPHPTNPFRTITVKRRLPIVSPQQVINSLRNLCSRFSATVEVKIKGTQVSFTTVPQMPTPDHISVQCNVLVQEPTLYKEKVNGPVCGYNPDSVTFKSCRDLSHGVELYKEDISSACGTSGVIGLSDIKANLSAVEKTFGKMISCSTCDNLSLQSKEELNEKLSCLENSMSEKMVSEAGQKEIVSSLNTIYKKGLPMMSEHFIDFIEQTNSRDQKVSNK